MEGGACDRTITEFCVAGIGKSLIWSWENEDSDPTKSNTSPLLDTLLRFRPVARLLGRESSWAKISPSSP